MEDLQQSDAAHGVRQQPRVQIINYSSGFEDLWSRALDSEGAPLGDVTDLILLWEGEARTDAADAKLLPHLTPLDWALLYSIRASDEGAKGGVSIHIVDLSGAQFRDAYAIRQRHQWLVEMPWVGLYGALSPPELAQMYHRKSYRPLHSSTDIARSLLRPSRDNGAEFEFNASHDLARLPRIRDVRLRARLTDLLVAWAASLPNSRDHHDLNNIVGPAILTGSADGGASYAIAKKVIALPWWEAGAKEFRATGLFPWNQSAQWFDRKLSVLVVDDDVHKGWGQFVQQVFGDPDPARASIRLLDNAEELVSFLETSAVYDRRDYCASLSSQAEDGLATAEIVFLDLRLTPDDDALSRQSSRLLKIVDRFDAVVSPAWDYINDEDVQLVREWCGNQSVGDPDFVRDKARLLLPMLLSLALPLTPIVLFSSTGQTWIKSRLKPYQNILTGFEKPRILAGYDAIASALDALRDALSFNAIPMLRLRLRLAHAQAAIRIADAARASAGKVAGDHIEVYADETEPVGGGSIVSGVVVAGFENRGAANRLQNTLYGEFLKTDDRRVWAALAMEGGAKKGKFDKGSSLKGNKKRATAQVAELLGLLDAARCRKDCAWSVVATAGKQGPLSLAALPSLRHFPDVGLDEALRFNIEFTLFALLPYLTLDKRPRTVALHLPTRRVVVDRGSSRQELIDRGRVQKALPLCDAFQIRGIEQADARVEWSLFTYDTSGKGTEEWNNVFPLVRAWLSAWPDLSAPKPQVEVVAIRATKLGRATSAGISKSEASRRRLVHDIADWACSASTSGGDHLRKSLIECDVIRNWILPDDADSFAHTSQQLMSALRVAQVNRVSESRDAIQLILRAGRVSTCDAALLDSPAASAQRLLLWALRETIETASGETLLSMLAVADASLDSD